MMKCFQFLGQSGFSQHPHTLLFHSDKGKNGHLTDGLRHFDFKLALENNYRRVSSCNADEVLSGSVVHFEMYTFPDACAFMCMSRNKM